MERLRRIWRAFVKALAEDAGYLAVEPEKLITVDIDTTQADAKLERLSAKVLVIQGHLSDVARTVNRVKWTLSSDKFEA